LVWIKAVVEEMSELVLVQFQHFQSAQSEQHAHWQLSDSVVVQAQSFQEVHLFNLGRDVHQPRVITEVDDLQILMGEELAINLLSCLFRRSSDVPCTNSLSSVCH